MIMPVRLLRCSTIVFFIFSFIAPALCAAQSIETEQLLRQQERERELRQRNET